MRQAGVSAPANEPVLAAATGVGDPISILIVDDEPKNLFVLETVLDSPGYRLVRAYSADQALLALIAEEFALIILDINMPGMSGFELAQMIRLRRKTAQVPIIFLTAYYNEDEHVLEGYAAGAVDFLHKPVNRNILRSKVATFAELHRTNRALQMEVAERRLAQDQLRAANETLEQRVADKTAALKATEAQLRSMIDALPAAIFATDEQGYLTHFNAATVQLAGRIPEVGVDRWCSSLRLYRTDGSSLPHDECPMAVALNEARIVRGQEMIVERPDGDRSWVMPYPTPLRDASGAVIGGINMLVDITEAKRSEQELSAAKLAAEVANAAKSDFLANMSHEIRTPMNAILGFTHLLSDLVQSPTEREWVQSIKRGGELLLTVINDVLDLSKIEAGKLVLHPQPCSVPDVVDDVVGLFRPQAAQKGIAIVHAGDGSALLLMLDSQRLRQVLMNLVSNAVKFTERGGVTITVAVREGAQPDLRELCLDVADSGIGIPEDQLAHIFEPFQQAESPDGKLRQGTGLGLTISKRLVDAMQGAITVASRVGEGTRFTVRLPDVLLSDAAPAHPSAADEEVDFNRLRPLRILAVDDNAWNLQIASGYLGGSHHELHLAHDGLEGVTQAKALRPDVVLMDLRMPVMDGYAASMLIRADPSLEGMAIVAVTASSVSPDDAAFQQAFAACVRKPYSPRDLFDVLWRLTADAAPANDAGPPSAWTRDLQARWAKLQFQELPALEARMRMREIGEFAVRLCGFAVESGYRDLELRSLALSSAVDSFDIKAISESLEGLSRLPHEFPYD